MAWCKGHLKQELLTVALRLPDGVAHAPHGCQDEEEQRVPLRDPDEQADDEGDVHDAAEAQHDLAGDPLRRQRHHDGADDAGHAHGDHDVADVLDVHRARHVVLK